MNSKNKILVLLLAVVTSFFFTSCEKELYEEHLQKKEYVVKDASIKNLEKNIASKIKSKVEIIQGIKKSSNSLQSKFEYNNQLGIYIDLDNGKLIEKEGKSYYTFPMFRENEEKLENIIFYQNSSEEIKTYFIKYDATPEEFKLMSSNEKQNVSKTYQTLAWNGPRHTCLTLEQVITTYTNCDYPDGIHPNGLVCAGTVQVYQYVFCNWDDEDADGGSSNTGESPSTGNNNGDNSSGIGIVNNNEIISTPIVSLDLPIVRQILNLLDPDQRVWWNKDATPEVKNDIKAFFPNNEAFTEENKQFVRQIIAQMILNPYLSLDFIASSKSPSNIDRSSIDTSTPEGAKFNLVYEELMKSPKFKELFKDLFDNNDRFNVKFQIGAVPNSANGNTDTDLENPTLNLITISPQYLLNSNKMEIAKTIIHECIHAFLNVKLCDAGQGLSIPNLNNMDFYNVVNQEYNGFTPGQNQHNFIYNYMIPTMVTILSEVKDLLVSTADNQTLLNDGVIHPYAPNPLPSQSFNWNDCLFNLCLNGLQNSQFFQDEIGTISMVNGQMLVINTIDPIKLNIFIQYINLCQTTLH